MDPQFFDYLTKTAFFVAFVIFFLVGLRLPRAAALYGAVAFIFGGILIAAIWSSSCSILHALNFVCNPKAAWFMGTGGGLLAAVLVKFFLKTKHP